jgi:hypothetical protein
VLKVIASVATAVEYIPRQVSRWDFMMDWFSGLDVKLQVTLLGIVSALLTILLKDVGLHFWKEARAERKTATEVYRNYSDPLISASEILFWRLRETLIDTGRGNYLKSSGSASYFDNYKFESTLYRLGVLVGWVRAYRRELTFLSLGGDEYLKPLTEALSRFEAALADGAHIEVQRVKSVSALWDLPIPEDSQKLSKIAVKVEQMLRSAGAAEDGAHRILMDLDSADQEKVCQEISDYLCDQAGINRISSEIVSETRARAVRSLSIREAWLYRDFQSGIGDMMICEVSGANRRFDVLGFKGFEELLHSDDEETKRWMDRLRRVFDELDVSGADKFDARVLMLEHTLMATIDILIALTEIDKGRNAFAEKTLQEARRVKGDMSWRKGA